MKPFKKFLFTVILSVTWSVATAQVTYDYHIGLISTFLSSDSLKSTPGFGIEIGGHSQARISPRFDFISTTSIYFSQFSVTGYGFSIASSSFDTTYKNSSESYNKIGLNYSLGAAYYIIPDKFNVSLSIAVAANDIMYTGTNQDNFIGAHQGNYPAARAGDLAGFNIDYGPRIGLNYRLPKVAFSLEYFKGFGNITAGDPFRTTMNDVVFGIHFFIREFSIAKPYQNKLSK